VFVLDTAAAVMSATPFALQTKSEFTELAAGGTNQGIVGPYDLHGTGCPNIMRVPAVFMQ